LLGWNSVSFFISIRTTERRESLRLFQKDSSGCTKGPQYHNTLQKHHEKNIFQKASTLEGWPAPILGNV
jgi:hypothetical protein